MGRRVSSYIWLCVALLATCGFLARLRWQDFEAAVSSVSWLEVFVAVLLVLSSNSILATRWLILLRVHQIHITFGQAVRLTYLGLFYNNMMPGSVGGDFVKGWFITHHCHPTKRIEAITTVFVDRVMGLVSMIGVAAIASLFVGSELRISSGVAVHDVIIGILGTFLVVATVFLSRRIRKSLMLSRVLGVLPFSRQLQKVDAAVRLYRHHMATMAQAILITLFTQGLAIAAVWMISQSLGLDNVGFLQCLMIMPIIWLISAAIPVPGGLGVMEYLFIPFFARAIDPTGAMPEGIAAAQAATLALFNRVIISVCSSPGAVVPVIGGHLPKAREILCEERTLASRSLLRNTSP